MTHKIPTYLIHGSLGSGKTTFIKGMLKTDDFKNSVVIENEFANINIDEASLKDTCDIDIYGIAGGCICCSSGRELFDAFDKIAKLENVKSLIIETTGVASSVKLIQQFMLNSEFDDNFYLSRNILVIDSLENSIDYLKKNKRLDIELADIVILSKIDLVDAQVVRKMKKFIISINSKVEINPQKIAERDESKSSDKLLKHLAELTKILNEDHTKNIDYIVVNPNKNLEIASINLFIKQIYDKKINLKRVKGTFETKNKLNYEIQATPKKINYVKLKAKPEKDYLVFIGEKLDKNVFNDFIKKYE